MFPEKEKIEKCENISQLEDLVSVCTRCSLYKTKTSDVFGAGSEKSEIMFIGEAPGKQEDLKGKPFVGTAGKLLTGFLKEAGYEREDIYIANVLKHRPPQNRDPKPEEAEVCWPYLLKQIELIKPTLIVFLGRHSLNRFFPSLKISETHGRAFRKNFGGRKQVFYALYHPAVAIYNSNMKDVLKNDFMKIPKIIKKIKKEKEGSNEKNKVQEKLF